MNKQPIEKKNENKKSEPEQKKLDTLGGKSLHDMLNLIHKSDSDSDSPEVDDDDDDKSSDSS